MAVRPLQPADMPFLYALYGDITAPLPHGFAAMRDEFCTSLNILPANLRMGEVFVAVRDGRPVGFARAGAHRSVGDRWSFAKPGEGLIFGPFVDSHHAAEGGELLAACVRWLRSHGITRVVGFDPVESVGAPFYNGGWCGLSEKLPHLIHLYTKAGFRVHYRELCLFRCGLHDIPPAPPPPTPLTLSYETRDHHRLSVKLYDRGLFAGACHYSSMYPRRGSHPDARSRGYIDGLAVPDERQGRGLGRILLLNALSRLRQMECVAVSLTTAADNFKAQNLYFSLGFHVVDSCLALTKDITDSCRRFHP